jgi:hypothetical protein
VSNEEDIWAAFLQSLLLKVKEEMPWHRRLLFNIMGVLKWQVDWRLAAKRVIQFLVRIVIVVVPLYFSLSNLVPSIQAGQSVPKTIAAGAGTLFSAVLGWYLVVQPYLQEMRKRVRIDLTGVIKDSPLKERVSVLDQFRALFRDMIIALAGRRGRVVVFVDDLDRCPPERIVQVLDAIKLFLDVPGCVYVLGLDREIIEQAVKTKFENYDNPSDEAQQYLEKIISLPFDLPPLSEKQMKDLVDGLNPHLPDAERSTEIFGLRP